MSHQSLQPSTVRSLDDYDIATAETTKSLRDYIDDNYGERCGDFDEHCATCKLWRLFDQFEAITR